MLPTRTTRWILGSASAAAAVVLGVWLWRSRAASPAVEAVVVSPEVVLEMYARRRAEQPPAPGAFPVGPLSEEEIRAFNPLLARRPERYVFDPHSHYRPASHLDVRMPWSEHPAGEYRWHTNADGLKETEEIADAPALRILVAGDSHTMGACGTDEAFPNLLERQLAASGTVAGPVEVLNAGVGGYSLHNYLGVLERFRPLRPDVFVVVVFGGNDFADMMLLQRYLANRPPPTLERRDQWKVTERLGPYQAPLFQELAQTLYFRRNPDDVEPARRAAEGFALEVARRCAADGIVPLFAYLPPPSGGTRQFDAVFTHAVGALDSLRPEELLVGHRLGEGWIAFLRERELPVLDLQPVLRASDEPVYWVRDLHINLRGHQLVADALQAEVTRLLAGR